MEVDNGPLTPELAFGMASLSEVEAILITALVAALVAAWGIVSQRIITRRLTTVQRIAETAADRDMIIARNEFNRLSDPDGKLSTCSSSGDLTSEEQDHVRAVLNDHELMSIGIQFGILDFKIICHNQKSTTLRDWQRSAPFIYKLRAELNNPALYHEFEELVRWMQDRKMPKRRWWPRLWL